MLKGVWAVHWTGQNLISDVCKELCRCASVLVNKHAVENVDIGNQIYSKHQFEVCQMYVSTVNSVIRRMLY